MARNKKTAGAGTTLRSMTGFGVGQARAAEVAFEVEIKSANSRFLDITLRLSRAASVFEAELRTEISSALERGRVELTVNRTLTTTRPVEVRLNRVAYAAFSDIYHSVGKELGASKEEVRSAILANVLSRSEVLEVQEPQFNPSRERSALIEATRKALEALQKMRSREGSHLCQDIRRRVRILGQIKGKIRARVALRPEATRDRILAAVKRLAAEVPLDQQRLHTEVALLADRADVTEELVRLESHLNHVESLLATSPAGKKLDFMVQELLREFNTIGSKAQEPAVQILVVEAKSELEKIREQVQNLE